MAENGFCDELPEDVLEMHDRTARSLANLWADGGEAAHQAILAALCRETLRMADLGTGGSPASGPDVEGIPFGYPSAGSGGVRG